MHDEFGQEGNPIREYIPATVNILYQQLALLTDAQLWKQRFETGLLSPVYRGQG